MIFQLRNEGKTADYDPNWDDEAKWEAVKSVSQEVNGFHRFELFKGDESVGTFGVRESDPDIELQLDYRLANALITVDIYAEEEAA